MKQINYTKSQVPETHVVFQKQSCFCLFLNNNNCNAKREKNNLLRGNITPPPPPPPPSECQIVRPVQA